MSAVAGVHRLPLPVARKAAAILMHRWHMGQDCEVVGSVRRCARDVGDLEFIAPLPEPDKPDLLYELLDREMRRPAPAGLFAAQQRAEEAGKKGDAVKGLHPGFKACTLMVDRTDGRGQFQVEINRYTPGPQGNRGWIELIRTGSQEFSHAVATHWKLMNRYGKDRKGSHEGWLLDEAERRIPTPTEPSVFHRCRLLYVEPQYRTCEEAVLYLDWIGDDRFKARVGAAMRALDIASMDELRMQVNEQRLAYVSAPKVYVKSA